MFAPAQRPTRGLGLALATLALALPHIPVSAQTEFRFSSAAPQASPFGKQIERLANDVATETAGAVKINPFFASQLGAEADVIGQVSRGRIDMGAFTIGALALQVPELGLLHLPFYFDSDAQRDCVMDQHVRPLAAEGLARKGLQLLSWGEVGAYHPIGKKGYATPADLRGAKMGIASNKVNAEFWKRVGAVPVPTAVADVGASLQTGLIDSYPSVLSYYVPAGLGKIAPVLTKIDLFSGLSAIVANKAAYDKLPAETRAAFDKGIVKTPTSTLRAEIRGLDRALLKMHTDAGGTVVEVSPEQRSQWTKDLPSFWLSMAKELGSPGEAMLAAMESGKATCAR